MDQESIESIRKRVGRAWESWAGRGGSVSILAGEASRKVAAMWGVDEREAFELAVRLAVAGMFEMTAHRAAYAVTFRHTLYGPRMPHIAQAMASLPAMVAALETADPSAPFEWQDASGESAPLALLVAFGALVQRDNKLYPATRSSAD